MPLDTERFWYQITFQVSEAQLEIAEDILQSLDVLTVSLLDAGDQPLLEPAPGEMPTWDQIIVSALFDQQQSPDTLLNELKNQLQHTGAINFAIETIENQHWERAWLDHFKPMRFGSRLWIYPSHITPPADDSVNIILDPGLAFGTGTHPTTALCLQWLDSQTLHNKTMIDYGCGSGILAIAALKLGASHAWGTDRDPQALTASKWNAEQNGVLSKLSLSLPGEFVPVKADIVVANILGGILIELHQTLSGLVKRGGKLVMSGLLTDQIDDVKTAFANDFSFTDTQTLENWVLLEATKQ